MSSRAPLAPSLLSSLVRPLQVGRRLAGDVLLESMRFDAEGSGLEYGLSTGLVVVVTALPREARWVTDRYALCVRGDDRRLSAHEIAAVQLLHALVSRNEWRTADDERANGEAPVPSASARPTLYLVPGHLGRETDLTLRALQVLAMTRHIFVETGQGASARALLERHGVASAGTQIIEFQEEPGAATELLALMHAGRDVALFGGSEGTPCFMDPGRLLLDAVVGLGDRAQVRSVGGASVLGLALMRATGNLGHFVFLGHLDTERALELVEPTLSRIDPAQTPLIFYAPSAGLRESLRRVAQRLAGRDLHLTLLCDLTLETEEHAEMRLSALLTDDAVPLPKTHGGVVAIVRSLKSSAPEPDASA